MTFKERLVELTDDADRKYEAWHGAKLKEHFKTIRYMLGVFKDNEDYVFTHENRDTVKQIKREILEVYEDTLSTLRSRKGDGNLQPRNINIQFSNEMDNHNEQLDWLEHAEKVLFSVETFHSHVTRRNPDLENKYPDDHRQKRSEAEQAWMYAQAKLYKLLGKHRRYLKHKAERKKKRAAEGGGKGKKTHKHGKGKPHTPKDMPPPGPREVPVEHSQLRSGARIKPAVPAFPERRVANPAIQPYSRPRVNSRLPAFPAFPAYRKN